jgi:hypothetical protein
MNTTDIKLAIINGLTLIITFSNFESFLKIFALIISIFYTGLKLIELGHNLYNKFFKKKINNDNEDRQ